MPCFQVGNRVGRLDCLVAKQLVGAVGVILGAGMVSDFVPPGREQSLKLDHLRVALCRNQIHTIERSLVVPMPDRQARDASGERRQPTGTNPQSVTAGMFQVEAPALAQLQEPSFALTGRAAVGLGRGIRIGQRLPHHSLSRLEISLNVRGRHRQHRADAVKPMQPWILVECAGCLDVVDDPEQIMDGVGVLLPAQPIVLQRTALGQALGRSLTDSPRQFIDDPAYLVRSRLLFLLRRHLAGVDAKPHLAPFLRDQRIREVGREIIEPELALLFLAVMTPETVRLEKCAGGNFKPLDTICIGNHYP